MANVSSAQNVQLPTRSANQDPLHPMIVLLHVHLVNDQSSLSVQRAAKRTTPMAQMQLVNLMAAAEPGANCAQQDLHTRWRNPRTLKTVFASTMQQLVHTFILMLAVNPASNAQQTRLLNKVPPPSLTVLPSSRLSTMQTNGFATVLAPIHNP
jgi:hypothetical protein